MSIKQMPGRVLISLLLSVTGLLSGCASHNENASLLAKKQAQNISQNLPIKSAGYTLVLAQSSGTTVKQPEPVPVAETRLNVVLRGIAFGARPGAVIEEGGKQQVYLQGETLGSHNAVIEEINRDHVMLRYQGKIERLSLAEEERSTVAVTNKKAVSDEAKQAVAEPAASAPVEIPTAVRQALAKDPQKIFNYIQLTPVRKEGIVGYAVKPGADRSLFDASGFKEGDIAIALNQQDFTDPRAMIALMRQLPSMDSIQLTVLRKGARHDISIALR